MGPIMRGYTMMDYQDEPPARPAEQKPQTAMVPLRDYAAPMASPLQGRVLTSYDMSTREGKLGVFRCKQQGDLRAADVLNRPIQVEHVLLHRVEMARDDGELVAVSRVVLVQPDGKRLTFVSDIIARQVADMVAAFGPVPFTPPLSITVREIALGDARRTYELHVAE